MLKCIHFSREKEAFSLLSVTKVVAVNLLYSYDSRFMSLSIMYSKVNWLVANISLIWVYIDQEYVVVKLMNRLYGILFFLVAGNNY